MVELPFDIESFHKTLGSLLTGVTVVTTKDRAGEYYGLTVNSFTSASLDPPLVLFCIEKKASTREAFTNSEGFNVHFLKADQGSLAEKFTKGASRERFAGIEAQETETGAPLIVGIESWLACRTKQSMDVGDHLIILGEVYDCKESNNRPLGFFQNQFQTFQMGEEIARYSSQAGARTTVAWILETEDRRVALHRGLSGQFEIPKLQLPSAKISDRHLAEHAKLAIGAETRIDFLFSLYEAADESLVLVYRGLIPPNHGNSLNERLMLVDLSRLADLEVTDPIERSILTRYDAERAEARFGIYSGTHSAGHVAQVEGVEEFSRKPYARRHKASPPSSILKGTES